MSGWMSVEPPCPDLGPQSSLLCGLSQAPAAKSSRECSTHEVLLDSFLEPSTQSCSVTQGPRARGRAILAGVMEGQQRLPHIFWKLGHIVGHVSYSFIEFSRNDRTPSLLYTLCLFLMRREREREKERRGVECGRERAHTTHGQPLCQARHFHPRQSVVSWFTQDAQKACAERSHLTNWKVKLHGAQVAPDQGL